MTPCGQTMKPHYSFSIPSLEDDTALDCRIYHPEGLDASLRRASDAESRVKGAIVAHPYAPMGGCYDDHVVLAVTETLLKQGFVVGTFNFRGAGDSAGRTSWTGKAEVQDYISFAGFMVYYSQHLYQAPTVAGSQAEAEQIHLTLGGYSYSSLILARFPATSDIIERFEAAEVGTEAAEIILRARKLAQQTRQDLLELQSPMSRQGRTLKPEQSPTSPSKRVSPMTVGGEETDPSERRRSRDSRRSVDVIRKSMEAPQRIKAHIKHRHVSRENGGSADHPEAMKTPHASPAGSRLPMVSTSYLFISPVLTPLTNALLPPGAPTLGLGLGRGDASPTKQYLQHPTLSLFGSNDAFTSSKRLTHWAKREAAESKAQFTWTQIDRAGHFWGEAGVLGILQQGVAEWTRALSRAALDGGAAG